MKKTLVSALTTALVVGAASTTFAAANPFEDVPADHWAYDAVAQLAADGVIEGYGDGTYRGDQEITRYEMAQMVARAMAKGANGADKALIDKLAAEFADELNNLGVRVAALEKKVDNVKWEGMVRYRYITRHEEHNSDRIRQDANNSGDAHANTNQVLLRLEPQMQINKNWTGKARLDYGSANDMDSAANDDSRSLTLDRIWVEGKYNNVLIKLGKFNVKTPSDFGQTLDYRIAGAEAVIGKDIKVALRGGRLNLNNAKAFAHGGYSSDGATNSPGARANDRNNGGDTATYYGVEVFGTQKKLSWGLGWHHVTGDKYNTLYNTGKDNLDIFDIGLGWKFDKNVNITGSYAFTNLADDTNGPSGSNFNHRGYKNAASLQLNYKGADKAKPGSWGAFVAYRHLGDFATIHPTCRENGAMNGGEKGFEIGVHYTFLKNILGKVQYYNGKEINSGHKVNAVWTELGFYF